jgi:hypothetical protein
MAGKAEIIVGVVNDGVTVGSGATALSDQFVVNGTGMVLVESNGANRCSNSERNVCY